MKSSFFWCLLLFIVINLCLIILFQVWQFKNNFKNSTSSSVSSIISPSSSSSSSLRGITVYLDAKSLMHKYFVIELAGLYASIVAVQTDRIPIDLIVFGDKLALQLLPSDWNCQNFESARADRHDCIAVEYNNDAIDVEKIEKAFEFARPDDASIDEKHHWLNIKHYENTYGYLKSLHYFLDEKSKFLNNYQWILKTDLDTFVTPKFLHWFPKETEFYAGIGGYGRHIVTQRKLSFWAKQFNLKHRGASWYGKGTVIRETGQLASILTHRLLDEAFRNKTEDSWPLWFHGVASMYGQELAVNHLVPEARPSIQLDYRTNRKSPRQTWKGDKFTVLDVSHLHCFYEPWFFSKRAFFHNKYVHYYNMTFNVMDPRLYAFEMSMRGKGIKNLTDNLFIYPEPNDQNINWSALDSLGEH